MDQIFTFFASSCGGTFFGLEPWYAYLKLSSNCSVSSFQVLPSGSTPSDVPLILLAVVDDLLRVAGLVAVGFVIYAAFEYLTSQGNPEQTGKAQSTIINALIGLAIAMVAIAVVSFLGNKFGQ
jgi:uncharacterized membrane protein YccC